MYHHTSSNPSHNQMILITISRDSAYPLRKSSVSIGYPLDISWTQLVVETRGKMNEKLFNTGYLSSLQRFYSFFFYNLRLEIDQHRRAGCFSSKHKNSNVHVNKHSKFNNANDLSQNNLDGQFILGSRRIFYLIILFIAVPALITWNHLGFLLDDLFFREWKHEPVIEPLFIIGNARWHNVLMIRIKSISLSYG